MAENKISYIARNYDDYKNEIKEITRKYYPDVFASLNDASIGEWLIELISDIGDNLSFHTDRVFQETNIDSASQFSSLNALARSNGLKMIGPKAAIVEVELSCEIPVNDVDSYGTQGRLSHPDEDYLPLIRRGTQFSTGAVTFELDEDVDFREQFNREGYSNRQIIPNRDTNGNIESYTYKKLAIAVAAQSVFHKVYIQSADIEPFMSIVLPYQNIIGVESIIARQGDKTNEDVTLAEYYVDEEMYYDYSGKPVQRYFEVENLVDQYRFGYVVEKYDGGTPNKKDELINYRNYYNPVWEEVKIPVSDEDGNSKFAGDKAPITTTIRQIARGKWKRLKNKFITEYTDDGEMKITFGAGIRNKYGNIPTNGNEFTQYMMSRMYANDYMGALPEPNTTLYVLFRVGGGEISNIAENTLTNIIFLNYNIDGNCENSRDEAMKRAVRDSLKVTNPSVSYGGKDMPTAEEIRQLIKYNNGGQNRCVTLDDYYLMLSKMPGKYGSPYRMGVIEENNKVVVYTLGLDSDGRLSNILSEVVAQNMKEYLSMYKTINDFVEIRSGKIINISISVTVYADKTYEEREVAQRILNTIYDYMDIRRHQMGEDIYLGDLQKEITQLDGVVQYVDMTVRNETGDGYSADETTQELVISDGEYDDYIEGNVIDLTKSDYILFSEANAMHEIKYKDKDIRVTIKKR